MAQAAERSRRSRRRSRRRGASTSVSAGRSRRRCLDALTAAADVALCRLHYYLERTARYKVDLEAHHPFQQLRISSVDVSFRTDMTNYQQELRKDISRLQGVQKALKKMLGAEATAEAQSAPASGAVGLRTSSSSSEGTEGTNFGVPQGSQRQVERHAASVLQRPQQRTPGDTADSGEDGRESYVSSAAGDIDESSEWASSGDAEEDSQDSSGCGAGAIGSRVARVFGDIDDGGEGHACPDDGGVAGTGQACPSDDDDDDAGDGHSCVPGDIDTHDASEAHQSYHIGADTEHQTDVGLSVNKSDRSKISSVLPTSNGDDNEEVLPSICTAIGRFKVLTLERHPLGWSATRITASSSARDVLHEAWRQYGLLCRLLRAHYKRLLRRSRVEPVERGRHRAAVRLVLGHGRLERAVAAVGAELLRARPLLEQGALRARGLREAAGGRRPSRPPRTRRSRRAAAAAALAAAVATPLPSPPPTPQASLSPPPSPPPPNWLQDGDLPPGDAGDGGFSVERLLSLLLCWRPPVSD